MSKYILRKGDIVFSRVGSVDRRSLVRDAENGWLFSGRCLRVRPDPDKIDPVYLSYFFGLPSFKEHIRAIAVGATMPSLNTEILSNVIVPYPQDLNEQHAIARILGSLDDKIEANRRMNETLEAMARSIFKSWFVDFDPVRAKAEGREPAGMDAETAALFPDSFEETELGMVPRGWKITSFTEAMEVNPTRFLKKGKAYSYLEMCNMPTNSARVIDIAGREFSSGTKLKMVTY
jgi:type I restriction enzyme S subunit